MPLLRMTMYGKGIQLYCAPTADGRDGWIATMQHIALEGRCFVLSCNQFARRSDYPTPYVTPFGDAPETVLSRGGSCIVNPLGQMLAGPNFTSEGIVTADLDLGDIARGKYDFDVVGHYARPDVFRLHVNEEPQPVVVGVTDPIRIECKEWKGSCRREWKVYLSSCQEERKPSRLGTKERRFALLIAVSLEELVPADHFYRHLECTLDVSFVRELVQQTCVGGGRPSLDPVVFFKLQLV